METSRFVIPLVARTKKNSPQIVRAKGRFIIIPSKAYRDYEKACGEHLKNVEPFLSPCNMKCLYYMPTHRAVDLCNLLEATCDILVHYGILIDDNSNIVKGHDGSRVLYDKEYPRTEIFLTEWEEETFKEDKYEL